MLKLCSTLVIFAVHVAIADAGVIFQFDADQDNWVNNEFEPFSVAFAAGEGVDGSGALKISGTYRDSWHIVHAWETDWPAQPNFTKITFDIRFQDPTIDFYYSSTGFKIKEDGGDESVVYLASNVISIGGGYRRVELTPKLIDGEGDPITNLPGARNTTGLNLRIGTTQSSYATPLIMFIDNIHALSSSEAVVPEPSAIAIWCVLGAGTLVMPRMRRREGIR